MLKNRYIFIILAMIVSPLEIWSQTDTSLILPNKIDGKVKFSISALPNFDAKKLGEEYLSVFVKNECAVYNSNAVHGRYTMEDNYLIFSPYFPFERGMTYVVRTKHLYKGSAYFYQPFQVGEKPVADEAKLISIYPSADELPENLLRFYLYFNTPMKRGQALKHIQLVDTNGNVDSHAFMEFKQELWSADGRRLTILFDPGRIKRGVSTNLELGPALLEGNKYQLIISETWQDVHGQTLSVKAKKEFMVTKAYRQLLDINEFKIRVPKPGSNDVLSMHFSRIIDHALVHSMIHIVDENEKRIAGNWQTSEGEKTVQFIPHKAWEKGSYQIKMNTSLEDVAGNNLSNLLDQKVNAEYKLDPEELTRKFSI